MPANVFRPSALTPKPYGWTRSPVYNKGDIPRVAGGDPLQAYAYEWLGSGGLDGVSDYANPPFLSGAAGRLIPSLRGEGDSPRILRGYIRRANRDPADNKSKARLYFMYNPAEISRQYLSYLDQEALDPFNSVYQSGNLVAPPSLVDFSFDLFFDRQAEAQNASHPGVLVDYQFFDMVVRNVNPTPGAGPAGLPDNGVMMINPQMITVVFSPYLTVQGYPTNAAVQFQKFTHRMTPVRMTIQLQLRATYFGPLTDQPLWKDTNVEIEAEQSTPWYEEHALEITIGTIEERVVQGLLSVAQDLGGMFGGNPGQPTAASSATAGAALDWAKAHVTVGQTFYTQNSPGRISPPASADCSGLVWSGYNGIGALDAIGFRSGGEFCQSMVDRWTSDNWSKCAKLIDMTTPQGKTMVRNEFAKVMRGDLLMRYTPNSPSQGDHIAFVESADASGFHVFDAAGKSATPQVGPRHLKMDKVADTYTWVLRPCPGASASGQRYVNQAQATWSTQGGTAV